MQAHQPNLTWPLISMALIIIANGFFVVVEFALITSRRSRLETMADSGSHPARIVLHMLRDPDRAIAAAQLGITAASILLGIVAEEPLAAVLAPILTPLFGSLINESAAAGMAAFLVLLILSFFHMVLGEQAPKIVAIRNPERVAQVIAYPMQIFARITAPFVWVVDKATELTLRLFGVKGVTGAHGAIASLEELKAVVQQSGKEGLLEEDAQEMVYRVFDFGERVVREVMAPRTNIIGIERQEPVSSLLRTFRNHRHSRFPIYDEGLDHIIGVISTKDLLALLVDQPEMQSQPIDSIGLMQEPLMVPESRLVADLFTEMRATNTGLAIVIDEFGGTAGLITVEELIEEIVGRITDEWTNQPLAHKITENVYEVDAQIDVDDVNEDLDITLPEQDEYETVAGLILYRLRRIPKVGQELTVPGYKLQVLALDGPKVTKVRIERV